MNRFNYLLPVFIICCVGQTRAQVSEQHAGLSCGARVSISGVRRDRYVVGVPRNAVYAELFNTDAAVYGGAYS